MNEKDRRMTRIGEMKNEKYGRMNGYLQRLNEGRDNE